MSYQNPNLIVPTAPPGTSNNQAASTQFVTRAIASATGTGTVNSVGNTDGSLTISPNTGNVTASLNVGHVNTWTANQAFPSIFIKNGYPWSDFRAWGAVGDGSTDDTGAMQNALSYAYGHGVPVFCPGGVFYTSSGVILDGATPLFGAGRGLSIITCNSSSGGSPINNDVTALTINTTAAKGAAVRDITIIGNQSGTATRNTIVVPYGVFCDFIFMQGLYGFSGLFTKGVGSQTVGSWFSGYNAGVTSAGANFYTQCYFDIVLGTSAVYAFNQGQNSPDPANLFENQFVNCDFSGQDATNTYQFSLYVNGNNQLVRTTQCIFSSPIQLVTAKAVLMVNCELGTTTFTNNIGNLLAMSNCFYGNGGTVHVNSTTLAANIGITT